MRRPSIGSLGAIGSVVACLVAVLSAGCAQEVQGRPPAASTATGGAPNEPAGATGGVNVGTGGMPAMPVDRVVPLTPFNLQCAPGQSDPPAPRRIIRLAPSEVINSVSAVVPLDPASVAPGFDTTTLGEAPAATDVVHKDFQLRVDAIATASASQVAANPTGLGCPVSAFGTDAQCTRDYLTMMAQRFFRGRVAPTDVDDLFNLASGVAARSDGKAALEYSLRAMVLSPKSLYLTEGLDRTQPVNLGEVMSVEELASFISYRIDRQPPTAEFVAALRAMPQLNAQALDTIIDQQFTPDQVIRGATNFYASWLNLSALTGSVNKDLNKHPTFTKAFLAELQKETYDTLFNQFLSPGNRTLGQLLTENVQSPLLNDAQNPLWATYGRPGILYMPGIITAVSGPEHTDLPKRGKFLVNALFCEGAQPPPPGIMFPDGEPGQTQRQKFEQIEALSGCGGCHTRINPLAYPMERYDEVGNPRALDEYMNVIDTSGAHAIVPGSMRDFLFADAADLGAKLAQRPEVHTCLSLQALEYVARRRAAAPTSTSRNDSCTVTAIRDAVVGRGLSLTEFYREALSHAALSPRAD